DLRGALDERRAAGVTEARTALMRLAVVIAEPRDRALLDTECAVQRDELRGTGEPDVAPEVSMRQFLVQAVPDDREPLLVARRGLELVEEAGGGDAPVLGRRDGLVKHDDARVVQEELVRIELRMRVRRGAMPLAGCIERGSPVVIALRIL